jgi:hypothetical protein
LGLQAGSLLLFEIASRAGCGYTKDEDHGKNR